jgi:hypothetical protein
VWPDRKDAIKKQCRCGLDVTVADWNRPLTSEASLRKRSKRSGSHEEIAFLVSTRFMVDKSRSLGLEKGRVEIGNRNESLDRYHATTIDAPATEKGHFERSPSDGGDYHQKIQFR